MTMNLRVGRALCAITLTVLATSSLGAQYRDPARVPSRGEFTPFGGFQWGGSFDTDGNGALIPSGELQLEDSFSWGGILGFNVQPGSAFELIYLRQDDQVKFDRSVGDTETLGDFATQYIHGGVRQSFGRGGPVVPFITFSLGATIFDAKDAGSSTRFSWSLGGGFRYMIQPANRIGIRSDIRWWVTPVPSGEYASWCSYWSCFVGEGTTWINQGQVSGGLIVAF